MHLQQQEALIELNQIEVPLQREKVIQEAHLLEVHLHQEAVLAEVHLPQEAVLLEAHLQADLEVINILNN
tara:strand:- start:22 stop:231 length:210 start_codon:yes stop_codon:yes gene_type:complete